MKKKNHFKSLANLLEQNSTGSVRTSGGKFFGQDTFDFLSLIQAWPKIVGDRLGKYTIPLKNHNNNLTVLTNHSAFSQQLGFLEEELKKKIIAKFPTLKGKVNRITFIYNTVHFEKQVNISKSFVKPEPEDNLKEKKIFHKYSPIYKKLKNEAMDLLSEIEDPEVKEILTSIYIQKKSE
ncbi:hypothetical protein A9Q84_08200 [Halobacteriovorax marinus]|uniref:DUF721 domain-containing protein n=1 Tax=Halobacteriovorax marinus TaxID=97084 RepID=A0A1Y5F621_9BACT|nr:hypothetical protein A9Q84_08200 [Halobacteriovorax marinus]